ncbi:acetoacetate metabolism regulatory protein AtoC [Desulfocucumis palustris]|uniref:Acetoacetate metabolism regulatory protein AtoC n=1 Tax=Desulfocucumis palustris TaxID=1898651 RepID=A0A2L2XHI0_9FIRM|nr:sigma 54-interacting transcriptional regulator [Desulfocucumis palustris]GBF33321.1 acetoacetate metabolism regulatory protein AtoC [Desulfocucumis palustris]
MSPHKHSSLTLLTKGQGNARILTRQLTDLLGDRVDVTGVCVDKPFSSVSLEADLIVASTTSVLNFIPQYIDQIRNRLLIARRTIDFKNLQLLLGLPPKTRAMLVNDRKETAEEVIQFLYGLGFEHLWLIPYYPGNPNPSRVEYAITPGEPQLVPPGIKNVLDLGTRKIDITTLAEILSRLGMLDEKASLLSARYISSIVDITKHLADSLGVNQKLNTLLQMVLDKITNGVLAADKEGRIIMLNKAAEKVLELRSEKCLGKENQVLQVLEVDKALRSGEPDENKTRVYQGKHLLVNNIPMLENEEPSGAICIFYELSEVEKIEKCLRKHLTKIGFTSKYTFSDIDGKSQKLLKQIDNAKRFAETDYNVLIIGESGTGKELFANAIHNYSRRKNRPFVAINCAALPIDLLESELFGFEEGTFTGARRGGKPGLFEQAHLGTIFLDEIGEIPAQVQAKLLRVLEEKEVMRVGGESLIPVDVRVIAATNKDLQKLVEKHQFREDLYYRLKVLSLKLPPLRERNSDIIAYAEQFVRQLDISTENFLSPEVKEAFVNYNWPGNIREVKNVIEYLATVVRGRTVAVEDLPAELLAVIEGDGGGWPESGIPTVGCTPEEMGLLKVLSQFCENGKTVGRKSLQQALLKTGIALTEDQVRNRLGHLEEKGLVLISRGRRGTSVTQSGLELIRRANAAN